MGASDLLPHTYRWSAEQTQRLRFRGTHLDAVRAGTKRCTIRFRDPVHVGQALLVFELPEPVALPGRITSTVPKQVSDITEEEASADGFPSAADVLRGLQDYYPIRSGSLSRGRSGDLRSRYLKRSWAGAVPAGDLPGRVRLRRHAPSAAAGIVATV